MSEIAEKLRDRQPAGRNPLPAPDRRAVMILAIGIAVCTIAVLSFILKGRASQLLLDLPSLHFKYPFTIQNFEHVLCCIGLGELYVRWRSGRSELSFLHLGLLPEDEETVLQVSDLGQYRRRVAGMSDGEHGFLPSLIEISILQFQSGRSVDQTVAVMQQSLELIQHRVDLRYSLIRYIAWLIPTLGFIGTVIGLGSSLAAVPSDAAELNLSQLAQTLAVGFDCTMVALVESAVLVFVLSLVDEKEEMAVNRAGQYTLRNLINRLYAA
jgi:biopolymer transport protein ExbB/TolQ